MAEMNCVPKHCKDWIMPMYNDINGGRKKLRATCIAHSRILSAYSTEFPRGHRSFFGLGCEEKVVSNAEQQTRWKVESDC